MSNLAPPGAPNKEARQLNVSQSNSDVAEYKDTASAQNSANSRRKSETERPLPQQVSAAFDDRGSSNADSNVLKLNRN